MAFRALRAFETEAMTSYALKTGDLAVYRILYASFVLIQVVPVAAWLPLAPKAFFNPPLGPAALFTTTPPASVLLALNILLSLFLSLLLVGWRTGVASVGTGVTMLILHSWAFSLGKINHDIFLVLVPLLLAFSGWGRALSVDAGRRPAPESAEAEAWPLALLGLLVGFAMFTGGWVKATTGWLDPEARATYGHLLQNYLFTGRETWAGGWALRIDSDWFWKPGDWGAVMLELGFLFAAIHRRSLCLFMALATFFHLGVLLLFDIPFSENVLAYGAFVRYTEVPAFRFLRGPGALSAPSRRTAGLTLVAAIAVGSAATLRGNATGDALHIPLHDVAIWAGAAAGGWYLARLLRGRAPRRPGRSTSSGAP